MMNKLLIIRKGWQYHHSPIIWPVIFLTDKDQLRDAVTKYSFRKVSRMASALNSPEADSSEVAAAGL